MESRLRADRLGLAVNAGHVGSVLSSIDALPKSMGPKGLLKLHVLHRAGMHVQTVELIRAELNTEKNIDPEVGVRLARFAQDAGGSELATELLAPAIPSLISADWLEAALVLSSDIPNVDLEKECVERLESLFPGVPRALLASPEDTAESREIRRNRSGTRERTRGRSRRKSPHFTGSSRPRSASRANPIIRRCLMKSDRCGQH